MGFDHIGVVGAGNMGSGIAQKIATEGFTVTVCDLGEDALERGRRRIEDTLREGVERRIFKPEQVEAILARLSFRSDLEALHDADLVIEAVFEDLQVKKDLFAKLDAVCSPKTILGTNTSSFYVDDVAKATNRPDRVVGLHYFYHPAKNRLVEVVAGSRTSEETDRTSWTLQERIGKVPIRSADAPGFVVNRYFVPWLNEAVRLLDEGISIPTIEHAAKERFQIGMGPFELMNVTGVPIALHAATTLGRELGPFYAPCERLARQVESGELWNLQGDPDENQDENQRERAADRLGAAVYLVAAQLVEQNVATLEDTDLGARVGLRWAKGPFEMMNELGLDRVLSACEDLAANHCGLEVPALLRERAQSGKPWALQHVTTTIQDGIAQIEIRRPDAMNALNPEVVKQLKRHFDDASQDHNVRAIVFAGSGKAFVAGADLKFFVEGIEANDFARIERFTRNGQDLLASFAQCSKPVIAKLDGLSLGGGSELALACDWIVATERGSMGFPETGIGIYPGLGGTQRPTRRIGVGLTRFFVLTGTPIPAKVAKNLGLVDELVTPEDMDAAIQRLSERPKPGPRMTPARVADPSWSKVADLFEKHSLEDLAAGHVTVSDHPALEKALGALARKAPIALQLAHRIIGEGKDLPMREALELEMKNLRTIFSTQDAKHGLTAATQRQRPTFVGA